MGTLLSPSSFKDLASPSTHTERFKEGKQNIFTLTEGSIKVRSTEQPSTGLLRPKLIRGLLTLVTFKFNNHNHR